jgi:hypothetical protein
MVETGDDRRAGEARAQRLFAVPYHTDILCEWERAEARPPQDSPKQGAEDIGCRTPHRLEQERGGRPGAGTGSGAHPLG